DSSHLALKLNTAGVIPPIFASSLLLLPATITGFSGPQGEGDVLTGINAFLGRGQPGYLIFYGSMIAFFAFFYTAIVFNPKETADNLKQHGGFIPGIRPGDRTSEYIDYVLTRITVLGALYLVFVCLIPEMFLTGLGISVFLGGTSLLIVVSVTLDTVQQVQSHLFAQQYEGLIKKAKLRGNKGAGGVRGGSSTRGGKRKK
ncbi:MAG: preprotein translocase subunit SecY, partial [Pseudomonadota bacterium]